MLIILQMKSYWEMMEPFIDMFLNSSQNPEGIVSVTSVLLHSDHVVSNFKEKAAPRKKNTMVFNSE